MQSIPDKRLNKVRLTLKNIESRLSVFSFPELDLIVGIASGGLVPAKLIAEKLCLPLKNIEINYRLQNNQPLYDHPKLIRADSFPEKNLRILLVDDVSVSGETLRTARNLLLGQQIKTFVLKGSADYVLFPEISTCVIWPWHRQ